MMGLGGKARPGPEASLPARPAPQHRDGRWGRCVCVCMGGLVRIPAAVRRPPGRGGAPPPHAGGDVSADAAPPPQPPAGSAVTRGAAAAAAPPRSGGYGGGGGRGPGREARRGLGGAARPDPPPVGRGRPGPGALPPPLPPFVPVSPGGAHVRPLPRHDVSPAALALLCAVPRRSPRRRRSQEGAWPPATAIPPPREAEPRPLCKSRRARTSCAANGSAAR